MNTSLIASKSNLRTYSPLTWAIVLLVSDLPNALWQVLVGEPPIWLIWVKAGLLLVIILASLVWKSLKPVRIYFALLFVLLLSLWGMNALRTSSSYLQWERQVSWVLGMTGYQLLKLAVVFIMIVVLLLLGRRRKEFYLTPGQLRTPIKASSDNKDPARHPLSWGALALILGICIAPLTLLFVGIGNLPRSEILIKALPLFPAALVFAATNAFAEEMQFRAALLGELQNVSGPDQAIWLTATFFGFFHYFGGTPAGMPGVLIAGLLGALFAKCMLGSKGLVVP